MSLFARKDMASLIAESEAGTLRRELGPVALVTLGIGAVIGAGIFVTVGMAAHDRAGPAVIVSFVVAAVACIAVALCYCECASRVPVQSVMRPVDMAAQRSARTANLRWPAWRTARSGWIIL